MDCIGEIRVRGGLATLCANGVELITVRAKDLKAHPVREGEDLDAEEYAARVAPGQLADAYEAALCMLDRSAKTAWQIENSLRQKGFVPAVRESVTERLRENRLIDDALFARRMVEAGQRAGTGLFALKQKMRAKGIAEEVAEEALTAIGEDSQLSAARALAQKLAPRYAGQPPRQARGKLSQALARKGFSWDVIASALECLPEDAGEFEE
ncbi:MAG TPA: RecX family transcriptional regulator [Candidatus Ornithocaccomicrobium faecavium]|uniref:Regulatory protein RecX n=1 Tax=Candidatus Ornithocaccomicrobium faecavium TaxID=2840890 RepID=A0A9D1PB07_9FIRM|nr:RecX family transcriptional regulator [Candidatus Ornithocaccomicrobium faecavium]